jgi:hypothetical protein
VDGTDLLSPAIDSALAVIRGAARSPSGLPPNARPSAPAPALSLRRPDKVPERPVPAPPPDEPPISFASTSPSPPPAYETLQLSEPPPQDSQEEDSGVPSSLEDAVMRQLSERSPFPGPTFGQARPLVEPSQLRPRGSEPPPDGPDSEETEARPMASLPPDAVVPDTTSADEGANVTPLQVEVTVTTPTPAGAEVQRTPAMPMPVDKTLPANAAPPVAAASEGTYVSPFAETAKEPAPEPPAAPPASAPRRQSQIETMPPTGEYSHIRDLAPAPSPSAKPAQRRSGLGVLAVLAVIGAAVAGVLYFTGSQTQELPQGQPLSVSGVAPPPVTPSAGPHVGSGGAAAPSVATATASPVSIATTDLPPGAEVPPGYGYLEVTAPAGARIRVDGTLVGSGPTAGTPSAPGHHEVRVEQAGHDSVQTVEVVSGKASRLRSASPP